MWRRDFRNSRKIINACCGIEKLITAENLGRRYGVRRHH
jgi:hypothetical protein